MTIVSSWAKADLLQHGLSNAHRDIVFEGDGHFALEERGGAQEARIHDGLPIPYKAPEAAWFFGRRTEALQVGEWLADVNVKGVAVAGVGGIGKSTLCRAVAARQGWRFPGGVVEITARPDGLFGAPTAGDMVLEAAAGLGINEQSPRQVAAALLDALTEEPAMLLFDNLETLTPDEQHRLLRFVEQLPLNGTKALLSLRPNPDELNQWPDVRVLTLARGLSPEAAAGYAVQQAEQRMPPVKPLAGARPSPDGWTGLSLSLAYATGGHPKMLEVAVALLGQHGLPALESGLPDATTADAETARALTAEALAAKRDELFKSGFELLDNAGRAVIFILPVFPTPSTTDAEGQSALAALDKSLDWRAEAPTASPPGSWPDTTICSCTTRPCPRWPPRPLRSTMKHAPRSSWRFWATPCST